MEKIILGIDPGTNIMGYGVLKVTSGPSTSRRPSQQVEMMTMGIIDLRKFEDAYLKLGHIFERVTGIIQSFLPDEMAIEAPFFGKNVQSMLNGSASKEQVAGMLQRLMKIPQEEMSRFMDATDALAAAYCHYLQMGRPNSDAPHYRGWKDFMNKNQQKIWTPKKPKDKDESSSSQD